MEGVTAGHDALCAEDGVGKNFKIKSNQPEVGLQIAEGNDSCPH
jgi:hypothetical protein